MTKDEHITFLNNHKILSYLYRCVALHLSNLVLIVTEIIFDVVELNEYYGRHEDHFAKIE